MTLTLGQIMAECREVNIAHGWRAPDGGICPGQTWGDYIALLHSEIGEALEAYRDHRLADATKPICGNEANTGNPCPVHGRGKPEGVGSEFADVLIRLVDMADVFGIRLSGYDRLTDLRAHTPDSRLSVVTFGDHMMWLHREISDAVLSPARLALVLRTLDTIARKYGIDLEAEYVRKIAYNRTRVWQHGGRTLAGDKETDPRLASGGKTTRKRDLLAAMPDDLRGWWTSEEVDHFISKWFGLELPEITLQDGSGEVLTLWVADVELAADQLVIGTRQYGATRGFDLTEGAYTVCVLQEKETKDA
jgi:NTP pyrophosphatase (non-canonical NTP hydrolase)